MPREARNIFRYQSWVRQHGILYKGGPRAQNPDQGRDTGSGADRNTGSAQGLGYRGWAASPGCVALTPPPGQRGQRLGPASGRQQHKFRRPDDPQVCPFSLGAFEVALRVVLSGTREKGLLEQSDVLALKGLSGLSGWRNSGR